MVWRLKNAYKCTSGGDIVKNEAYRTTIKITIKGMRSRSAKSFDTRPTVIPRAIATTNKPIKSTKVMSIGASA